MLLVYGGGGFDNSSSEYSKSTVDVRSSLMEGVSTGGVSSEGVLSDVEVFGMSEIGMRDFDLLIIKKQLSND